MPRKPSQADPVAAFFAASRSYAKAKNRLQTAIHEDALTPEQRLCFELLSDGFSTATPMAENENRTQTKETRENAVNAKATALRK